MPVTLDLSRVSKKKCQHTLASNVAGRGSFTRTFGSIARLVVLGEAAQVLVLDPRHPVLVLVVVALGDPLVVRLALLLVCRQRIESLLLLVLGHGVPLGRCGRGGVLCFRAGVLCAFLECVGHCVV